MTAVAEIPRAVIEPHPVDATIPDKGVQVAVSVQVAQGCVIAPGIPQGLAAVAEGPCPVIQPHLVSRGAGIIIINIGVQIAVSIQVAKCHGIATTTTPQALTAVHKDAGAALYTCPELPHSAVNGRAGAIQYAGGNAGLHQFTGEEIPGWVVEDSRGVGGAKADSPVHRPLHPAVNRDSLGSNAALPDGVVHSDGQGGAQGGAMRIAGRIDAGDSYDV